MQIQAGVPWRSRTFSAKWLVATLATLLVTWLAYFFLAPAVRACVWAVEHHSTATYQDLTLKVPWMWRQEETPAGQREIELVRARFGEAVELERLVIRKEYSTALDRQTLTGLVQNVARLSHEEFRGTPISLDAETARHFSCVAPHLQTAQHWQAACESTDKRWSVNLLGPVPDVYSLKIVLQSAVIDSDNH